MSANAVKDWSEFGAIVHVCYVTFCSSEQNLVSSSPQKVTESSDDSPVHSPFPLFEEQVGCI